MKKIAYIVKGYPRLSETFIAQEILGLEKLGFEITIYSLRKPTDNKYHPIHEKIKADIIYISEYVWREPWRVFKAWWSQRGQPTYKYAWKTCRVDFKKDRSLSRIRRFAQSLVLATEIKKDTEHLHAHFLHTPASVTQYASLLLNIPWSVSAHAKDIWTQEPQEITRKLMNSEWAVTCTLYAAQYLKTLSPKVELIYHGIDFSRFPLKAIKAQGQVTRILSVGRCVNKKGYDILLKALSIFPKTLPWCFIHIGTGACLEALKQQAVELNISDQIEWRGAQSYEEVLDAYRQADLFVLPCRIAEDGDRDGLPNVLMEALSQGLPLISTSISGISELIEHEVTGLLVPPEDPLRLSVAIQRLIENWHLSEKLVQQGQERLQQKFNYQKGIERLAKKFAHRLLRTDEVA